MKILSKLIPSSILGIREDMIIKSYANKHKKTILDFLYSGQFPSDNTNNLIKYIRQNGVHVFPYTFTKKYDYKRVKVYLDESCDMHYVMHKDKRLYYKRGMSTRQIQRRYNMSLIEQDPESAHCYIDNTFNISSNSIVADIGVAEGNFSLENIERVNKIYLFEADESWIEALTKTFEPWKDKVTIINKYISDTLGDKQETIDNFFSNRKIDFLKIDVDGAEMKLLEGGRNTILNGELKIAICTYHNQNDWDDFNDFFKSFAINISSSPNYMLFYYDMEFKPPFFRKGVMRIQT